MRKLRVNPLTRDELGDPSSQIGYLSNFGVTFPEEKMTAMMD